MANMSYCRFSNTLGDLRDCSNSLHRISSERELRAAKRLIQLCRQIGTIDENELELEPEEPEEDFEEGG